MAETKTVPPLLWNERVSTLANMILTSLMMVCLVISLVQIGELLNPGWDGAYLVILGFVVALESMYAMRFLKNYSFLEPGWLLYRLAEWVIILAALKAGSYLDAGAGQLWFDLPKWQQNFCQNFLTLEFILGIMVMLLVWLLSYQFSAELMLLEVDEKVLRVEEESGIFEVRTAIRDRLVQMILYIGVGMTLLAALLRSQAFTNWVELPLLRSGVQNLVIYFLLGLILLSLTQFNLLRVSWIFERLPVDQDIARRWIGYSLAYIALIAFISSLLPTGYTISFLTILNYLSLIFSALISLILLILISPIFIVLGWLAGLLGGSAPGTPQIPQIQPFTPQPRPEQTPVSWWEVLSSLLFWAVFLGVIGFSIYYYLRENRQLWLSLKKTPLVSMLVRFWEWLRAWAGDMNRQVTLAAGEGWQRLRQRFSRQSAQDAWRYINLRSLTPRQRILFYFLALVRRSGERGISRQPSQTPYEYSAVLSEAFQANLAAGDSREKLDVPILLESEHTGEESEIIADITGMTERFVEARYSRHPISDQEAGRVKDTWQKIRQALKRVFPPGKER